MKVYRNGVTAMFRWFAGRLGQNLEPVSYTHLRAHETLRYLVCRLLLEKKMEEPSLWEVFLQFLSSLGNDSLKLKKDGRSSEPPDSSEDIQDLLEKIYRNHPDSALVCEMLTDLDEGLQEWRYRHVQMVRRTIGTKSGTGGSSGVDYLKGTLMKPLFPDLWAIRNRF